MTTATTALTPDVEAAFDEIRNFPRSAMDAVERAAHTKIVAALDALPTTTATMTMREWMQGVDDVEDRIQTVQVSNDGLIWAPINRRILRMGPNFVDIATTFGDNATMVMVPGDHRVLAASDTLLLVTNDRSTTLYVKSDRPRWGEPA